MCCRFSHPDFDRRYRNHTDSTAARPPFADYTAGRDFHPAPKQTDYNTNSAQTQQLFRIISLYIELSGIKVEKYDKTKNCCKLRVGVI